MDVHPQTASPVSSDFGSEPKVYSLHRWVFGALFTAALFGLGSGLAVDFVRQQLLPVYQTLFLIGLCGLAMLTLLQVAQKRILLCVTQIESMIQSRWETKLLSYEKSQVDKWQTQVSQLENQIQALTIQLEKTKEESEQQAFKTCQDILNHAGYEVASLAQSLKIVVKDFGRFSETEVQQKLKKIYNALTTIEGKLKVDG